MAAIFGFPWLLYYLIHDRANDFINFSYTYDFDEPLNRIRDYLNDSNNLLTYLKSIGSGIARILSALPPLIMYFLVVCFIVTLISLLIRLVFEIF